METINFYYFKYRPSALFRYGPERRATADGEASGMYKRGLETLTTIDTSSKYSKESDLQEEMQTGAP